jgi:glutathione synthase/RimK-type ligase-like ATP-grasp enzyme
MNGLLYTGITTETALSLAKELEVNAYKNEIKDRRIDTLIRWGCGGGVARRPTKVINSKQAVNRALDKLAATHLFQNSGIPTVEFSQDIPCVGRTVFHTQGQGFWFCFSPGQVNTSMQEGAEYFIKYIPTKQEWRVHVLGGQTAFVQKKYLRDRISTSFTTIQGFSSNWHKKVLPKIEAPISVRRAAEQACILLGLDMGGVDILEAIGTPSTIHVLEVNTGPALPTEETRAPYITFIKRKLEGE